MPLAHAGQAVATSKIKAPLAAVLPGTAQAGAPAYWGQACAYLIKEDRVLRRLIPQREGAVLRPRDDAFATLARSIMGQQVSVAAAQRIWERFAALAGDVTPQGVLRLKVDDLRGAGLSARKVEYLVDLALHFDDGRLHVDEWPVMDDEAITQELMAIRGVGRWTAEMLLIFHLARPNVLPLDDVGLARGISRHYFSGEAVSRSEIREVAQAWAPWCSVASWYIWRSLEPLPGG